MTIDLGLRFVARNSEGTQNKMYVDDLTSYTENDVSLGFVITLGDVIVYQDSVGTFSLNGKNQTLEVSAPTTDGFPTNGTYTVYVRIQDNETLDVTTGTKSFVLDYTAPTNLLTIVVDGYSSTITDRDSYDYANLTVNSYELRHVDPNAVESTSATQTLLISPTIYAGTHTLYLTADVTWEGTDVSLNDYVTHYTTAVAYKLDEDTIMDAVDALKESYRVNLQVNRSEARNQRLLIDEIDLYENDYWIAVRRYDKLTAYLSLLQIYDILNEDLVTTGEIPVYETIPESIERIDTELIRLGYGMTAGATTHDYIDFNTEYSNGDVEGRLNWNADDGTLEVCLPGGNVHLQIGQETVVRCKNSTGTPIANGAVVYISGASGQRPTIALADADSYTLSFVLGVATETIGNGQNGYVTITGLVRELNTNSLTEGQPIWLSQTAGQLTSTRPSAPAISVFVGYCLYQHGTQGIIAVRPNFVPRLTGLSDVYGTPSDGNVPAYVNANSRFEFGKNIIVPTAKIGTSTNYTEFESDGTMVAKGTAITYRDEYVGGEWVLPQGVTAPDAVNVTIGGITYRMYSFDGNVTVESLSNSFEIPQDKALSQINDESQKVEWHVHMMTSTASAGSVSFIINYVYLPKDGTAISPDPLTITCPTNKGQYVHCVEGVEIPKPSSGFAIGDIILFNITRNPALDTYPDDVLLIKTALHIPMDTLGSRQRYIK